ncbi:MAG: hypothetical protein ACC649_06630, partial [Myxococcota bacterium]
MDGVVVEFREELLTVAELAVGIAGFSAVVAAFSRRDTYDYRDVVRFLILFTTAGVAIALAFVPSILSDLGLSGPRLWRTASLIMIAAWFAQMIPSTLRLTRDVKGAEPGEGPTRSFVLTVFVSA